MSIQRTACIEKQAIPRIEKQAIPRKRLISASFHGIIPLDEHLV